MTPPLDPARTAGFTLGPGRDEALRTVQLLHGFTGSPWELRLLGEALGDRGFHVACQRLPGHGTTPEAMLWATWRDWLGAAEAQLLSLSDGGHPVAIAGLSMGGLLAMLLAAKHPQRVSKLVLLAPATQLLGFQVKVARALRRAGVLEHANPWVPKTSTDLRDDAQRANAPILPRYPLARLFDLFTLQDEAAAVVARGEVQAPALVAAAVDDHVVPFAAVEALCRQLPHARLLRLERGYHILPRDLDRARLITEVAEFLDGV